VAVASVCLVPAMSLSDATQPQPSPARALSGCAPAATARRSPFRRLAACVLPDIIFFALFYAYVWLRIDPRLIYHSQSPTFILDWRFFFAHLHYPGGLTDYVAAFLAQSYGYGHVGALVITAVAWLVCAAGSLLRKLLGGTSIACAHLVPGAILLILHNRYDYSLAASLALLFSLVSMSIQVSVFPRRAAGRAATFCVLAALLYFAVGSVYLLFAIALAAFEVLHRRRSRIAALYVIWAAFLPYLAGKYVLDVRTADVYTVLLPPSLDAVPLLWSAILYGFFLLVVVTAAPFWHPGPDAAHNPGTADSPALLSHTRVGMCVGGTTLLIAATAAVLALTFDSGEKSLLRIDLAARRQMWPQVLAAARSLPPERYRLSTCWDVNRALFHAGLLLDEMFAYPQDAAVQADTDSTLLCGSQPEATDRLNPRTKIVLGEVFLELGRVGEAEFETNEGLAFFGDEPQLIERLFLIHSAKQERGPAQAFLAALSKHILWRERAREYSHLVEADPSQAPDPYLDKVRAVMIRKEEVGSVPVTTMLQGLLDRNPTNRMAATYLVAHHLLHREIRAVIADLDRLDPLAYPHLPRHCEEAILLHTKGGAESEPGPHGRRIHPEARSRYRSFMEIYYRYRPDNQAAKKALAAGYHDTYYFYYTFGGQDVSSHRWGRGTR